MGLNQIIQNSTLEIHEFNFNSLNPKNSAETCRTPHRSNVSLTRLRLDPPSVCLERRWESNSPTPGEQWRTRPRLRLSSVGDGGSGKKASIYRMTNIARRSSVRISNELEQSCMHGSSRLQRRIPRAKMTNKPRSRAVKHASFPKPRSAASVFRRWSVPLSVCVTCWCGLQMNDVYDLIKRHSSRWLDWHGNQLQLPPEAMNLYHTADNLIKPSTKEHECSYVETIATGSQMPVWFLSQ